MRYQFFQLRWEDWINEKVLRIDFDSHFRSVCAIWGIVHVILLIWLKKGDRLDEKAMKFLFRAPLLDFDPQDEKEIVENWDRILKIISVSSTSLYGEVSQKTYNSLSTKLKKKVYKYVVRGRYRSTPFGLLAAVGLGEFKDNGSYSLDLRNVSPLPQNPAKFLPENSNQACFYLSGAGYEKFGKLQFLVYQSQDERWGLASIPKNKSIKYILNQLTESKPIKFEQFKEYFEDCAAIPAKEIWHLMIDLGIFNSVEFAYSTKQHFKPKTDMVFNDEVSLPTGVINLIREFHDESGNLFCRSENLFLKSFRNWFTDNFDDRFVPLHLLGQSDDFLNKAFLKKQDGIGEFEALSGFNLDLSSLKSLDLKPYFPKKPIDPGVFDLQIAFNTCNGPSPIVFDNVVCNRPFVYFGRFNREETLYCKQKKTRDEIYQSHDVQYVELKLIESSNAASICDTKQVMEYYITPIYEPNPNAISLDEVELGLNGSEFQLIHKSSRRKIVPVIVHPLNGEEISHPIMRLLWEIAHQSPYDFFPYSLRKQKSVNYLPQLRWGQIILQSRRWVIEYFSFTTFQELNQWMENMMIPNPIVMGYLDRELVLHWNEKRDLEILWTELCKWKRLTLHDPIWLKDPLFYSQNNRPIYPQFIVQKSCVKNEIPLPVFVNSIDTVARDCLYILFRIQEEECEDFLDYFFDQKLLDFLRQQEILWYYLVYPNQEKIQVRIRFLNLNRNQKTHLNSRLLEVSENCRLDYEVRPYYPEQKKYGKVDYTKSERLFHLESRLLRESRLKQDGENLIINDLIKLELIVKLWFCIIEEIQAEEYYFTFFKGKVKSLPRQETKEFRDYLDKIKIGSKGINEFRDWLQSYQEILFSHSRLWTEIEVGMALVQNHIHMQVNRFFSTERGKMESLVYFLLYRKIGEQLFKNQKRIREGTSVF